MNLERSTILHFSTQIAITVSGFVATFVIARLLGSSSLGAYTVVVALVFWLSLPVTAIGEAVNKRVSEGKRRGEFLTAGFLLTVAGVLLVGVPLLLFDDLLNEYLGASLALLFVFLYASNAGFEWILSALKGQKRVAHSGGVQAIERVIRTATQVGLILLGWKVGGLVLGHALSLGIAALSGIVFFRVRPAVPSVEQFRSLLRYARYSWLGALKTRSFAWMDTIVLSFFVVDSLIGIYEVAWTLASVFALVSISIQRTLFPEVSELGVEEEYDRIRSFLREGVIFTGVFGIPGLFGAAILGSSILSMYRPEFTRGETILIVLIIARMAAAYGRQFMSVINAIDRPDVAFRINLLFVVSNMGLNVVLVWQFGWYGAAVATTVSAVLLLLTAYYSLDSLIGAPKVPVGEIGKQVLAATVMAAVIAPLNYYSPAGHHFTLGLVGFGAAIYAGLLYALSPYVRTKFRTVVPAVENL
ncbi:oligosaccharide flippase family protein [Halostella litorea]|uniref:oligosaccharide flippase family protein n=1 Tax=Halostella litorea TaxID=2528831 RepID=UPI0010926BE9|nr:polysaccharide biosynthesis C-terminal domain-containing protein [Halostella litorea]